MSRYGEVIAPGTVRFERKLPGPIERVWAYLTEPDKRAEWLAGGAIDLRPGGAAVLEFDHDSLSREEAAPPARYADQAAGHVMRGRVTACEPPRLISYSWVEDSNPDSEVTFELREDGEHVLLVLTHRRLGGDENLRPVAAGWHTHLEILGVRLEGRAPGAFWAAYLSNEAEYRERI